MTACYRCHKGFPDWPGAFSLCPACFAKRPARLNRRLPAGWRPEPEPITLPEVRALFDLAEADRTRYPRKLRTVIEHRGEHLEVDASIFGLRLWRGSRLLARRWGLGL